MMRQRLLVCGLVAPLLFVAMTLFVGLRWDGYSLTAQTPSELAAIGAPTRALWLVFSSIYSLLMVGFGVSAYASAGRNRALRVVGILLAAQALFGALWPPMHQRAVLAAGGGTLTDRNRTNRPFGRKRIRRADSPSRARIATATSAHLTGK
jgi:hypothetical protein